MKLVPRWLLQTVFERKGQRLPKLVHFEPPKPVHVLGESSLKSNPVSSLAVFDSRWTKKAPSFQLGDFAFWMVNLADNVTDSFVCRSCGEGCSNLVTRLEHQRNGCAFRLNKAYKLLLRDMGCVICDKKTTKTKWGMPFCTTTCIETFMYYSATPQALYDALGVVDAL